MANTKLEVIRRLIQDPEISNILYVNGMTYNFSNSTSIIILSTTGKKECLASIFYSPHLGVLNSKTEDAITDAQIVTLNNLFDKNPYFARPLPSKENAEKKKSQRPSLASIPCTLRERGSCTGHQPVVTQFHPDSELDKDIPYSPSPISPKDSPSKAAFSPSDTPVQLPKLLPLFHIHSRIKGDPKSDLFKLPELSSVDSEDEGSRLAQDLR